ncbi:MAG: AMP-dependent synthetase [Rhodobacteraceae bacterium PARR1]|nr:MAG: AMP-dependent synthetase [Rhodobacteraceae bacterium PARR1]
MTPDFVTSLSRHGDRPALILTGRPAVSYADLADRAARFAARLGPVGRKLVAIEAAASVEMVAAYLGALSGGHAVALLPAGDRAAMDRFRRDFAPDAVWSRQAGRWRLMLDPRPTEDLHPDLALVLMTSGSTGHGKGVRLAGQALSANAAAIVDYLALTADDRAALVLPLHYSYGLSVLNSHLAVGASVWLAEGSMLDGGFAARLADSGATNLSTVPHGFDLIAQTGLSDALPPALRLLTVAGGALRPVVQRDFARRMARRGGRFVAMYGQTEAAARIAYLPPELADSHAGMIGQAIPGGSLSLRDELGRDVTGEGAEGELCYTGPNVMMGYATARADLARGAEVSVLPTGDIARYEGGFYRLIGRKRRMSKIAGLRIGHDAVEAALAEAGVTAAVWGDDAALHVAVEGAVDADDLLSRVASLTGLTAAHLRLTALPRLPRLPNGKPDYPALHRLPPPRPQGADVAEAFRLAFHPRPVRAQDSFASLGGDSLRHVELSLALERHLGHLPTGWERMALSDLRALTCRPARSRVTLGVEHPLRAAAILAVVVAHETAWPVYGGAAIMVVLIGLMLARFRRDALAGGDVAAILHPLGRVLVPYYLILFGYALAWDRFPIGSALLVSNFGIGAPATFDRLPFLYWFVEAYAQMLVLLVALVMVPQVRRLVADRPMTFGAGLLAGAMVLRRGAPSLMGIGGQVQFTVPWVLYLLALGWMAGVAQGRQRWLVLGLAALVLPMVAWLGGNWHGAWIKYGMVFAAIALLLFRPQVSLPRALARGVLTLASAAFMVYLTHRLVPNVLLQPWLGILPGWLFATLSIAGGVGLGIAAHHLSRGLSRLGAAQRLWPRPQA